MKIVINGCYGGFGLSRAAIARLAELQGRPCFFFSNDIRTGVYAHAPEGERVFILFAFDIPNPNEVLARRDDRLGMSIEERIAENKRRASHAIEARPENRADPLLVRVVEELGEAADGDYAKLHIVEIPDGIEWEIDEYDGIERIHEKHRSWS